MRINKSKDAKRRARKAAQKAARAGAMKTGVRIIPDKRKKPARTQRAEILEYC